MNRLKHSRKILAFILKFCGSKKALVGQEMREFNTNVQSSNSLRLTIVSAKPKIHSPRRGYLSPGNSIVLEKETALLFISVITC